MFQNTPPQQFVYQNTIEENEEYIFEEGEKNNERIVRNNLNLYATQETQPEQEGAIPECEFPKEEQNRLPIMNNNATEKEKCYELYNFESSQEFIKPIEIILTEVTKTQESEAQKTDFVNRQSNTSDAEKQKTVVVNRVSINDSTKEDLTIQAPSYAILNGENKKYKSMEAEKNKSFAEYLEVNI